MGKPTDTSTTSVPIRIVQTETAWQHVRQALRSCNMLAVDILTDGHDPRTDQVRILTLATVDEVYVLDVSHLRDLGALVELFRDPRRLKIMHHGKRVLLFLAELLDFQEPLGRLCVTVFDTLLAAQLLQHVSREVELSELVRLKLNQELPVPSVLDGHLQPSQNLLELAGRSTATLFPLRQVLRDELVRADLVTVAKLEFDLVPVVADMERTGIYINLAEWNKTWEVYRKQREELSRAVSESLGSHMPRSLFGTPLFNPDSPQQTLEALKRIGLDLPHTGDSLLRQYADRFPAVRDLLAYRGVAKLISSCGDVFPQYVHPKTKRIHPTFHQIGARTGRMSCSEPNVQQVPKRTDIRSCFQAAPGNVFVVADYSQVELRVAAALAQDRRMIQAYRKRQDLHRLTASLLTGSSPDKVSPADRDAAKAVNFGLLYAMGARGLARYAKSQYGVDMSVAQAEAFRHRFFAAYQGIRQWHERALRDMQRAERGANVELRSVAGRRFIYHGQQKLTWFLNTPVQSSAADLMKKAMLRVHHALAAAKVGRIIAVVHDELLVEAPAGQGKEIAFIVSREMEAAGAEFFPEVPFEAEARIVPNWAGG